MKTDPLPTLDSLQVCDQKALKSLHERLYPGYSRRLSRAASLRPQVAWLVQAAVAGVEIDAFQQSILTQLSHSNRSKSTIGTGTRLVREWHGTNHIVEVLREGFSYQGKTYKSLSEIARLITGTRWSGPRFFGLGRKKT
jgi:hypothetical protein